MFRPVCHYSTFPILILLHTAFLEQISGHFDEQPCLDKGGVCLQEGVDDCCGGNGKFVHGLCPKQSSSIKCCICVNWSSCEYKGGQCVYERTCNLATSRLISNICAKLPTEVKCCVPRDIDQQQTCQHRGSGGQCIHTVFNVHANNGEGNNFLFHRIVHVEHGATGETSSSQFGQRSSQTKEGNKQMLLKKDGKNQKD